MSRASRRTARIIALVGALVLVVAAGALVTTRHSGDEASPSTGDTASAAASPSTSPAVSSTPSGCMADPRPITPTTMTIDRMKVSSPVVSLGLDADNAAAAPPKDEPRTVAWFNRGPMPGSDKGKVVLSIHTFHNGGALGNELQNPSSGLAKGDLIRLADSSGEQVCYRFDHVAKVMVKSYDPSSTIIYDNTGRPMVVIVICWDYNAPDKQWDSRLLYYATPVAA